MPFTIETVPCLTDNYAYLIVDQDLAACAVVDPADADTVAAHLRGRRLTHILNTHHHADHTGGNLALKQRFGARVVGPARDAGRIPGIDDGVDETSTPTLFGMPMRVLETPGHTVGAVVFVIAGAAFTGDTLFAMGCGRLFEGDAPTMRASLCKIASLPDDTAIHCGHEYTEKNARFARTIEPNNAALRQRESAVLQARERGEATVPFSLAEEKATNPFLRTGSPDIRANLHLEDASDDAVFAALRRRRDGF